ncbi:MAG: hypothetical protein EOQ44_25160 [Mesorhizobium sp.]|uniref:hypothetical protein n=1 Tax=Mesorhizobium sp. TaxID=1871066 RepID=UPI000FE94000|nr:hypothetical protein [Mesorhizobium sp.]RWB40435.1 MAG: hypothetical protein EOQ44_25160 [Mesorhizobium sp.]
MANEPAPLKTWRVTDRLGNVEFIKAHFMFTEESTGVVSFGYKTPTQSYVPAVFGAGQYISCILENPPVEEQPAEGSRPKGVLPFQPKPNRRHKQELDDEIPF